MTAPTKDLARSEWSEGTLELHLANTLDALDASRPELERFQEIHGLDARVANRLEVVFEELVSNVIRHGFTPGSDQSVQVWLKSNDDQVELMVEDDGKPFDLLARAEPAPLSSLESAPLGGLGIPLVRKMASQITYESAEGRSRRAGSALKPVNRVTVFLARPS